MLRVNICAKKIRRDWSWQQLREQKLLMICEILKSNLTDHIKSISWMHRQPSLTLCAVNSLVSGRPGCHFKTAIFNIVLLIGIFTSSNDYALRWMPWDLAGDKSTLVQVMAWCRQATSHYLSQCWPSSMSTYGVTRSQRVQVFCIVTKFNSQHNTQHLIKHTGVLVTSISYWIDCSCVENIAYSIWMMSHKHDAHKDAA